MYKYCATTAVCISYMHASGFTRWLPMSLLQHCCCCSSIHCCSQHKNQTQSITTCVFAVCSKASSAPCHYYWMPVFNILAYRLPFTSITTNKTHGRSHANNSNIIISQCIFINITIQNCHIFHLALGWIFFFHFRLTIFLVSFSFWAVNNKCCCIFCSHIVPIHTCEWNRIEKEFK